MLIIRRRSGESIRIGEQIEVRVIELSPGHVTLGITAPPEVVILRSEIQLAREENVAAARGVNPRTIEWITRRLRDSAGRRSKFDSKSLLSKPIREA